MATRKPVTMPLRAGGKTLASARGPSSGNSGGEEVTVEGEIERVTFESAESGFRVLKLARDGSPGADLLTVVGTIPPVAAGTRVRVRGRFERDRKHGEQLRALGVTELLPTTLVGVERYLGSGLIKGIGEGYAKKIVAHFGMDTLRVLDEEPERLAEVDGLGKKRSDSVTKAWREQRAVREVMVFLQAHGASGALAGRIYKRYGANAVRIVSTEPYRLAMDVWGIGFKTADRIARELGVENDSPARMQAGLMQTLNDALESGHTCLSVEDAVAHAMALLELAELDAADTPERVREALRALVRGRYVVAELADGEPLVFLAKMHAAEVRVAERLKELAGASARPLGGAAQAVAEFERRADVELAPEQREAVARAADNPVLVITGGPGVGKTTIVRAILSVLDRENIDFRLCAPTGRAAKRLSESTGRPASTVHRLLEFEPKRSEFKRNKQSPLECDALVVDEASMIDLTMADAITQALTDGTRLVLVGDVDQLPSVGPGAFLRDVIASGAIPCVRLTQIFRQAEQSLIVQSAHRINMGEPPLASNRPDADFFLIERDSAESAQSTIVSLLTQRIPRRFGLDPRHDVQVLTPMHRGPAGTVALNEALQAALNPTGPSITRASRSYRLHDKVMQLRNDYDREVYNGDVGEIVELNEEQGTLTVRYDEERRAVYEAGDLDELALAYAVSIHKSQGSEYPAVVLPLMTAHFVMLSRNLLYTAVTRGKRLVVLIYDPRALSLALAEDRRGERRTRLQARLRG
ncbi:ATP-dependent RecD-like DNA helicase [Pendulispora albinea]|uniref:ATP-dependent RecD-like DNA helicase n=1 Tax=Pendulispora albinea TaxID=2741071 RepID=A0ABZ2LX36_9BACT